METIKTNIPEVIRLKPYVFSDERGFFMETFRTNWLPDFHFVQDNHSKSIKNTLRGLHYQLKNPQGKLVRVTQGEVFDVAVDLRLSSETYGRWTGCILNETNKELFWVPPGFAHGFLVLSETAEFQYKCTDFYRPYDECSIAWNDPDIAIDWPCKSQPLLSKKDSDAPLLKDASVYPKRFFEVPS